MLETQGPLRAGTRQLRCTHDAVGVPRLGTAGLDPQRSLAGVQFAASECRDESFGRWDQPPELKGRGISILSTLRYEEN
jgi:hypothetical protein